MKYITAILLNLAAIPVINAQIKDTLWYPATKQPKEIIEYTSLNGDTIRHGRYHYYLENGTLGQSGCYDHGELHGTWKIYFPDESLKQLLPYVNGKLHGTMSSFLPDGTIVQSAEYKDDQLNGRVEIYNSDGSLSETSEYMGGQLHGVARAYPAVRTAGYRLTG